MQLGKYGRILCGIKIKLSNSRDQYIYARVYMPGSRERISKYYVPGSPVLIKYIKSKEKRTALNFNLYPRMIEKIGR